MYENPKIRYIRKYYHTDLLIQVALRAKFKEVLIVNNSKNKFHKSIVIVLFCLLPVNNYFI